MRVTQFAQLTAFAAVAEHRSFTKAATYLGISTPSLSQAIRGLEEQFGVRFLNRTTRKVSLTEAGEQLLGHLSPVLEGVENAVDAINLFRDKPTGRFAQWHCAATTMIARWLDVSRISSDQLEIFVDDERRNRQRRFDAGIHFEKGRRRNDGNTGGRKIRLDRASPTISRIDAQLFQDDLRKPNCIRIAGPAREPGSWRFEKAIEKSKRSMARDLNDLDPALRAGSRD